MDDSRAAVCISVDFELNWAFRELSEEVRNLKGTIERKNIPFVLKLLNDYGIPVTWATVGHLFLMNCDRGKNNHAHPMMPRPLFNDRWEGDWYLHDPSTNLHEDPLWYAPDLIEQILKSEVAHEIGTHSFSHIDFSPEISNKELIKSEIEECIKAMKHFGIKPRSLVFPFNKMGYSYLELLSMLGIIAVRHRDEKVRLSYPERTENGIYKIYESMNLRSPKYYDYLDKTKIFIEVAMRRQAAFHLWFHPSDPSQIFENEFRRILEYIYSEREKGLLWVATMGELASYCEAREKIKLKVHRISNKIIIEVDSLLDNEKFGTPEVSLLIPSDRVPKEALMELNKSFQPLNKKKLIFKQSKQQLLVNLPVSAKSLQIKY